MTRIANSSVNHVPPERFELPCVHYAFNWFEARGDMKACEHTLRNAIIIGLHQPIYSETL